MAKSKTDKIFIGTSGWTYAPWRGLFYPKNLTQKQELYYASRQLTSIEINSTFYRIQSAKTFQSWHEQTPDNFVFAVKGPQFLTHVRRLKNFETPLANFFASGVLALREKLGPILWQFPPSVMLKDSRFEDFFANIPKNVGEAITIGKKHSDFLKGKTFLGGDRKHPIRHAFEFRHKSFLSEEFFDKMKNYNIALVWPHAGAYFPFCETVTSDFVYLRMHGQGKEYGKGYSNKFLKNFSKQVLSWSESLEVFCYFDNEAKDFAPKCARELIAMVS